MKPEEMNAELHVIGKLCDPSSKREWTMKLSEIEIRAGDESGNPPVIKGYAAVFNARSEDMGGWREIIAPGAFKKTIGEADIRVLWNHETKYVLGRNKAGTAQFMEDQKGLYFEVNPPDVVWARDLQVSMQRGDVNQMSFGFQTIKDSWDDTKKPIMRTLHEVRLFEVSIVTFPAYPQTSVKVRENLALAGINYDRFSEVMFRKYRGLEIDGEDKKFIEEIRSLLNVILEPSPGHSEDRNPPKRSAVEDARLQRILDS